MSILDFGRYGVQLAFWDSTANRFAREPRAVGWAQEIERLGYGTLWIAGGPPADLAAIEELLDATESLRVATGILNIWSAPAVEVAASFQRIDAKHPGRFTLGIGVGHQEHTQEYRSPYAALVEYLDTLDAEGVPKERRVLAALGPKVLRLSEERAAGAYPYLVPAKYTAQAREALGTEAFLGVSHNTAAFDNPDEARAIGRSSVLEYYFELKNYRDNLRRLGYTDADLANGGSDEVVDALVAHGAPGQIAAKLEEHHGAGANHVAITLLPSAEDPLPALRSLAETLAL